jgi:hypothetical protein
LSVSVLLADTPRRDVETVSVRRREKTKQPQMPIGPATQTVQSLREVEQPLELRPLLAAR